jgi:signal transduction histidine kinase
MSSKLDDGRQTPPRSWIEDELRLDERRHIARELHDSTSQLLVVLQLQLGQLHRLGGPEVSALVADCEATIADIRQQIREFDAE